jgi:hypothetical protein
MDWYVGYTREQAKWSRIRTGNFQIKNKKRSGIYIDEKSYTESRLHKLIKITSKDW